MFDIVFISYNEPNADSNWNDLKKRFPNSLRLHGIKGIHNAHRTGAQRLLSYITGAIQSDSLPKYTHFWVVDGDSIILENFDFSPPSDIWKDAVYVYRSQNPINGLTYGYGGIKLLPIKETANMEINGVDMTTSISKNFFAVDQIASITNFNTDPFNTWKSAFRECVKLSSKIIDGQVDNETEERLNVWCTKTLEDNIPYAEWGIKGAVLGKNYGIENKNSPENLKKINDFTWLEEKFNELYN